MKIEPELWEFIANGDMQDAFDRLSGDIPERPDHISKDYISFSDSRHLTTFLQNIHASKKYGYLYDLYLKSPLLDTSNNPTKRIRKRSLFVTFFKEAVKEDHKPIIIPKIPDGASFVDIVKTCCEELDIPVSYTKDGKWKTPYIPVCCHFYTIVEGKAYGCKDRKLMAIFNNPKLRGVTSCDNGLHIGQLGFCILKGQLENFKSDLVRMIESFDHSFEGYSVTMEDFIDDTNKDKNTCDTILSQEMMKYLPESASDYNKCYAMLSTIAKQVRERKLNILQEAGRSSSVVFIPKVYKNLAFDDKKIQINDGSIWIEEMDYAEHLKFVED